MSTEFVTSPQGGTFEVVRPGPSPEELFAAHVAQTREADVLDVQKTLTGKVVGVVTMAASFAAGLVTSAEKPGVTPIVAALGVMGCAWWARARQKRQEFNNTLVRLNASTQIDLNEQYELYRLKDKSIAMHWRGNQEFMEDTAEALENAALRAGRHGIKRMIIDKVTLARLRLLTSKHALPGEEVSADAWLQQHKKLKVKLRRSVQEAAPEEWAEYARKLTRYETGRGISALMETLKEFDPKHPLLQIFESWQKAREAGEEVSATQLKRMLLERIAPVLRQRFGGAERARVSLKADFSDLSEELTLPTHYRVQVDAQLKGDNVQRWRNGWLESTDPIEQGLGITPEMARLLVRAPHIDRQLAHDTMLYLIYAECHNTPKNYVQAKTAATQAKELSGTGFQERIAMANAGIKVSGRADDIIERAVAFKRLTVYGGAIAAAALSAFITVGVDGRHDSVADQANRQLAIQHGLDPETGEVEQAQIRQRMKEWHGINEVWSTWIDARTVISFRLPSSVSDAETGDAASAKRVEIGNVGNAPDRIEYKLTASGGMRTDGYWWHSTSDMLLETDEGFAWEIAPRSPFAVVEVSEPDLSKPYIHVEHQINPSNEGIVLPRGKEEPPDIMIKIPVREGTVVSAAKVDGKPVVVDSYSDGTYGIVLQNGAMGAGKLEYWLAEANKSSGPHSVNDAKFGQSSKIGFADTHLPTFTDIEAAVLEKWERYVPGITQMDLDARRKAIDAYLKTELTYSRNPFDKPSDYDKPKYASFVEKVLKEDETNCTTTATVRKLSVNNPKEVGVFGYINHPGRGVTTLSTREAHMALVDDHGQIIDDTPPGSGNVLDEIAEKPTSPLQPWMLIPGVIGVASLAYYRRRSIVRVSVAAATMLRNVEVAADSALIDSYLKQFSPEQLALAVEASSQISFGADFDFASSQALSKTDRSKAHARERLKQPHIYDPEVIRKLAKRGDIPATVPAALRLARLASKSRH